MQSKLKEKVMLVTGGTGSIGGEIVRQLLGFGVGKVIVFAKDGMENVPFERDNGKIELIEADIKDYASIEKIFNDHKIDVVYHAAAVKHIDFCEDFPAESTVTNIFGTKNLVDIAVKNNIPKLITISTDKAAHPVSVLGATKLIAERITLNAGYSCVRLGNVANSRESVIPVFVHSVLDGRTINITCPNATRFVIQIPKAAEAIIRSAGRMLGGEIFILKMKAFTLQNLLDVIVERIGPRLGKSKKDIKVNISGLRKGEKKHEVLANNMELDRLYETEEFYVLLKDDAQASQNHDIKKINLNNYSSKNAEKLSSGDLEKIVDSYLESIL